jgi:hypothetical protein
MSEVPFPQITVEGDGYPDKSLTLSSVTPARHDAEECEERAVYVAVAESDDKALVDTWKDDTEGIIIFVRHSGFISLCFHMGVQVVTMLLVRFIFS